MRCIFSIAFHTIVLCWVIVNEEGFILVIFGCVSKLSNLDTRLLGATKLFNTFSNICSPNSRLIPGISLIMIVYTQYRRLWYYSINTTDWCTLKGTFLTIIPMNIPNPFNSLVTNCVPASVKIMSRGSKYVSIYIKQNYSSTILAEIFCSYQAAEKWVVLLMIWSTRLSAKYIILTIIW